MNDSWDERRKALEEQYFDEQNRQALSRLKTRESQKRRLSPITGEPMEEFTLMGVVVDRCPTSGGIWLDKGELEEIIKTAKSHGKEGEGLLTEFFATIFQKKG